MVSVACRTVLRAVYQRKWAVSYGGAARSEARTRRWQGGARPLIKY